MGSALISIGNEAFYGCSSLTGTFVIPQGVTSVGIGAFQGCRALQSVLIPNSVTSIGGNAFNGCSNLKTVRIDDGTVSLTFSNTNHFVNSPIETLHLGRNHTGNPFASNSALKTVTIGKDVTAINANGFLNCTGITQITSNPATPPTIQANTFNGVPKTIPVYVPLGSLGSYRGAANWSAFTNFQNI